MVDGNRRSRRSKDEDQGGPGAGAPAAAPAPALYVPTEAPGGSGASGIERLYLCLAAIAVVVAQVQGLAAANGMAAAVFLVDALVNATGFRRAKARVHVPTAKLLKAKRAHRRDLLRRAKVSLLVGVLNAAAVMVHGQPIIDALMLTVGALAMHAYRDHYPTWEAARSAAKVPAPAKDSSWLVRQGAFYREHFGKDWLEDSMGVRNGALYVHLGILLIFGLFAGLCSAPGSDYRSDPVYRAGQGLIDAIRPDQGQTGVVNFGIGRYEILPSGLGGCGLHVELELRGRTTISEFSPTMTSALSSILKAQDGLPYLLPASSDPSSRGRVAFVRLEGARGQQHIVVDSTSTARISDSGLIAFVDASTPITMKAGSQNTCPRQALDRLDDLARRMRSARRP